MESKYGEVCDIAMRHREHKDSLIKKTVIALVPTLAAFDPEMFVTVQFPSWMSYLVAQIKRERDRQGGTAI